MVSNEIGLVTSNCGTSGVSQRNRLTAGSTAATRRNPITGDGGFDWYTLTSDDTGNPTTDCTNEEAPDSGWGSEEVAVAARFECETCTDSESAHAPGLDAAIF